MKPKVVVVCQEGGHQVALEYGRLLEGEGYQIMVNFPSLEEFSHSDTPSQLINERTEAIVLIVSEDLFPASGRTSDFKIDTEIIHDLLTVTKSEARPRLIPILTNEGVEPLLKNHWLGQLQYVVDNAVEREKVLHRINLLAGRSSFGTDISAFDDVGTIISAIEPGYNILKIASERVSEERVSYEIFECRHKVRKEATYYIHLHKRITISNTANHIRENYPSIFAATNKTALLAIEDGQTQIEDRLRNVTDALNCRSSLYLEQIISGIIDDEFAELQEAIDGSVNRDFLEPQVRRGYGKSGYDSPYEFIDIIRWISSQRPGVLVLLGQGGIGKTWALLNLKQRIAQGNIKFSKSIKRSLVFITSTDVNKGVASAHLNQRSITLYDLYVAHHVATYGEDAKGNVLGRETFYDAIELGNLIVFIDGLDEIISRNRARFDPDAFFGDLNDRLIGDTTGKVIISCRNIFFDFDQARIDYPYIETWELLAFDVPKRDEYFDDQLSCMPNRLHFAKELSDQIARLPNGRYIPFVLSLIRKIALEVADNPNGKISRNYESEFLTSSRHFDRIVGQFCNREIDKAADPTIELSVDQQIRVFCQIARIQETGRGLMSQAGVETALSEILHRRDVKAVAKHLATHPFISQEALKSREIVSFSFDFMPEYFLMLDAHLRLRSENSLSADDIKIYNKYCSANSSFAQEIVERWTAGSDEFRIRLLDLKDAASVIIQATLPKEDWDILSPESAAAQFSFSIVSMLAIQTLATGQGDIQEFTDALTEIFEEDGTIKSMAILDGFVLGEERMRVDFRGKTIEDCLFHSIDFWNCKFDDKTTFKNCRFMKCGRTFVRSNGAHEATWDDCQFDAEFEETFERGQDKVENSEFKKLQAIKSLISDFYRAGGFRPISKENIQQYYGQSNSVVPFNKLYKTLRNAEILTETNKGHFLEVRIAREAMDACERLITQGDPEDIIQRACDAL